MTNEDTSNAKNAGVVAIVVLVVAGIPAIVTAAKNYLKRKKEEAAKRRAEARNKANEEVRNADAYFSNIAEGRIILDSNIWMDEKYDSLFTVLSEFLKRREKTLEIASEQYYEIINMKDRGFEDDKSKRARYALSKIESLQKIGMLTILGLTARGGRSKHADPAIIELLRNSPESAGALFLVTNDRDLRIRAVQIVNESNRGRFQILDSSELLAIAQKRRKTILNASFHD